MFSKKSEVIKKLLSSLPLMLSAFDTVGWFPLREFVKLLKKLFTNNYGCAA